MWRPSLSGKRVVAKLGFPVPNRPETLVVVAECQDVRLDGSGGTNPVRRFWTRLPAALRRQSNFQRDRFAVYLTGGPSAQNPGSISFSPVRGRSRSRPGCRSGIVAAGSRVSEVLAIRLEPGGRLVLIIDIGQGGRIEPPPPAFSGRK